MPYIIGPQTPTHLSMDNGVVQSGILTTTSTSADTLVSLALATYRSVDYQIQAVRGTNYNSTTAKVVHDGSNTYMTEFATINQPAGVATYSSDISGDNIRLLVYPSSATSTTFKVVYTAIKV